MGALLVANPDQITALLAAEVPAGVTLLFTLQPGLGGAWTELHGGRELIRFGYPEGSATPWFQVTHDPGPRRHHAATLALERIVFARAIKRILLAEPAWEAMVRRAIAVHPGTELTLTSLATAEVARG